MKKSLVCIGAFLVLFLMFGGFTAQAQPGTPVPALVGLDATWLKLSGSLSGYEFTGAWGTTAPTNKFKANFKNLFACVSYDPAATEATFNVYDKDAALMGYGTLYTESGSAVEWVGYVNIYMVESGAFINEETTPTTFWVYGSVYGKIQNAKGTVKSMSLEGGLFTDAAPTTNPYALGGGKLTAKIVTNNVPLTCPGFTPPAQ